MTGGTASCPDRRVVDVSLLAIRVIVGTIFAAHGAQKLLGAFGGAGLEQTVANLGPIAYPVAVGEFFGGLGMIVGFLTRFSAASNIVIMLGAIVHVHGQNGFFMANKGYEYNLALIGLLIPLVLVGPGRYAITHYLPLPKSPRTGRTIAPLE